MARTVAEAFAATAAAHGAHPFLIVPARADRDWHPGGAEFSYGAAAAEIAGLERALPAGRLRPRPPRRPAAGEPAGVLLPLPCAQRPRRRHRADQPGLSPRRDRLPPRPQRGRAGRRAAAARGRRCRGRRRAGASDGRRRRAGAAVRAAARCGTRAARRARPRDGMRAALHLGHDGASQGLHAVELLFPERRRATTSVWAASPPSATRGSASTIRCRCST